MPDRDITELIAEVRGGNRAVADALFDRVHREVRKLAGFRSTRR
jgi:hypothetical protein